jgi:drug/metabolite transporter superfamily protein YnfA
VTLDEAHAARLRPSVLGRFACDGRGACCQLYDRLMLSAEDAGRVYAAYGEDYTPGGLLVDSAVVRERPGREIFGLAVVDGACVMLEPDGLCGVHKRLGPSGKPDSCRNYPLRDVLCGDELAVGLGVECRCAIDFAGGPSIDAEAEALLARRRALGEVEAVAEAVPLLHGRSVAREAYVCWRQEAAARLEAADDVITWALDEAAQLAGGPSRTRAAWLARLGGTLEQMQGWLAGEATDTGRVYGATNLQHRLFAWGAAAVERLRAGALGPQAAEGEALLARQLLHTHGLLRAPTLTVGLVLLALRLEIARASAGLPLSPALLPVSGVEYFGRVYALGARTEAVAAEIEAAAGPT